MFERSRLFIHALHGWKMKFFCDKIKLRSRARHTHRHSRVFNSSSVLGQGLTLAWFLFIFSEHCHCRALRIEHWHFAISRGELLWFAYRLRSCPKAEMEMTSQFRLMSIEIAVGILEIWHHDGFLYLFTVAKMHELSFQAFTLPQKLN